MYGEGDVVDQNGKLSFLYLKRSAEEGYVVAQHMLGLAYYSGINTRKNLLLALSWFREAVRNGNVSSYLNAGDILYEGGLGVKQNRMFALVNYLGAYREGAYFLKAKIDQVVKELKEIEGEQLPEFLMPDEIPKKENQSEEVENS